MLDSAVMEKSRGIGLVDKLRIKHMRRALRAIDRDVLRRLAYTDLRAEFEANKPFREAVVAYSPLLAAKARFRDRVLILNPESETPIDAEMIREGVRWPTTPIDNAYSEFQNTLNLLEKAPCQVSRLVVRKLALENHKRFKDKMKRRTARWAANVLSVARGGEMNVSLGLHSVYILFGGAAHMGLLQDHLEGKVSTVFLRPAG